MNHIPWVEKTFHKRDCVHIIPSSREPHRCIPGCQICQKLVRCCCGRLVRQHSWYNGSPGINLSGVHSKLNQESGPWTSDKHTVKSSTDAYGTIAFQGGSRGFKAKYIRISNDSKAEDILHLMVKVWKMSIPRLVISVHGGMQKFELHASLKEALYRGLVKAAVTTGAWILTGGINNGVAAYIGEAIKEDDSGLSHTVCTVGIAPWGIIEGRNDLLGQNVVAPYQTLTNPLSKLHVLNSYHSHFLLVDDGTVGRHGGELHTRRGLEWKISQQQIHARTGRRVPLVALVIEGGPNTIYTVFEYLQQSPPVPVVVCEGSGRAADLLAYIYKQTESCGSLPEGLETDIMSTIKKMFAVNQREAAHLFQTLMACMRVKNLITVFHTESGEHLEIDVAILTALLKGINTSPSDQFVLALAWNRVDIAKNQIFLQGQQWRAGALEQAMLDALVMDRVDFVKLLIENGVSMHKFLTIPRLEELYNAKQNVNNDTLLLLIQDVKKGHFPASYKIPLLDIGLVVEYLMGGSYRCSYTKKHFRLMYKTLNQRSARNNATTSLPHCEKKERLEGVGRKEKTRHGHFIQTAQPYKPKVNGSSTEIKSNSGKDDMVENEDQMPKPFTYPFNELLIWAVLTKRQKMALYFWQLGEESMAKALVARKLYQAMAHEADQSEIVDDTSQKLNEYSKEFGDLAVELLDKAYQQDERMAMKLLTYELNNWSKSTCLKLAVSSKFRAFVGHTCTQKLLSDMWIGRLKLRKNSWFKVILGLLMPPIIPMLEYKTEEEMSHIPQSQDAHEMIVDEKEVKHLDEGIAMNTFNEVTFSDGLWGNSSEIRNETKHCYLPLARKFYAFYHAPIVKFWFNTMAYMAFLMLYAFVVLVKMENLPSVQEWIVISVIFTTGLEKIREVMSEAGKITQKLKVWFSSYFNANDTVAIITFLIGVGLRLGSIRYMNNDDSTENMVLIAGRLIYCLNIIFWIARLLDILNVNPDAGPYVLMIGKMISKMFFIVVIMAIVVIAFGVPKKAILYPHETPSWSLAKEVIFRPYWMTFGEVYAYEIDVCANDSVVPDLCGTGTWLTQFLQAVYLFVQYIIMVNLLIAMFNNVYMQGKAISDMLWKFQRYHLIMIYQDKPILPPPFILISHVASIISWLCRQQKKSKAHRTKLFLTEEEQKTLHDFEQHCVGIYFRDKKDHDRTKSEERIRVTNERVEQIFNDMKDVGNRVSFIKHSLRCLDHHIGHLQDLSGLTLDSVNTLMAQRALASSSGHSMTSFDLSLSRHTSDDGIGRSVTGKKGKSDHFLGHSFSQPCNTPWMMKSQSKFNVSEAGPIVSGLFQTVGSLPDFQQRTLFEDRNTCIYNQKLKSLIKRTNPVDMSSQVLARKTMKPETKSAQSKHDSEQQLFPSFHPPNHVYPDSEETCRREGYVNCGFIDDKGYSIDVSKGSINETEEPWVKQPGEMHDGNTLQEEHTEDFTMERSKDNINPIQNRGNRFAGIFQRFWTKSKRTDDGHHVEKQMSIETDSTDIEAYPEEENNLRQLDSFSDLSDFQPSTNHLQSDGAATYEELQQSDSKAALLRESYYNRYSSSHRKMSFQKYSLNGFGPDFIPSMDTSFYYSAIERNNLFRLSQSIPFTPLPPAGELVTVYRLEESSPDILNNSMSSWLPQGFYAKIEFLGREEMGGGLRRAVKVACAWCENHILKAGHLYIIKSFLPEVVDTWAGIYKEDTVLQLCLREIQQQRAAQKLLFAFNQMKPKTIAYSPKFLEVFLLYCHSAGHWFTVEECMAGRFKKYNNNTGNEPAPKNKLEETMLAFSHWTYEYTKGEFLVLDLQGVGENLTDPCVIKAGDGRSHDMIFGPANLGDDAIQNFCSQHQCNSCCRKLKLPELKQNDYLQHETLENRLVNISNEGSREEPSQDPVPD